jgi:hypothetical protein
VKVRQIAEDGNYFLANEWATHPRCFVAWDRSFQRAAATEDTGIWFPIRRTQRRSGPCPPSRFQEESIIARNTMLRPRPRRDHSRIPGPILGDRSREVRSHQLIMDAPPVKRTERESTDGKMGHDCTFRRNTRDPDDAS